MSPVSRETREPDGYVLRTRFPGGEVTTDWFTGSPRSWTVEGLRKLAEGRNERGYQSEVLPVYIGDTPDPVGVADERALREALQAAHDEMASCPQCCNSAALASRTAEPREPQSADTVKMPESEDEAAMMALIGVEWLRENAPHRLTKVELARAALSSTPASRGGA